MNVWSLIATMVAVLIVLFSILNEEKPYQTFEVQCSKERVMIYHSQEQKPQQEELELCQETEPKPSR